MENEKREYCDTHILIDIGNNPSNQQLYEDYKAWLKEEIERLKSKGGLYNDIGKDYTEKLKFLELQDEPEPDYGKMQVVASKLNPNWLAVVSKPSIVNCGRPHDFDDNQTKKWWEVSQSFHREKSAEEWRKNHPRMDFNFVCPKKWNEMEPTENRKVRFCGDCKKNVYFCDNIVEARELGNQGCCVGIDVGVKRKKDDHFGEFAIFGNPKPEHIEENKTRPMPDRISAKRIMKKAELYMKGKTTLLPNDHSPEYTD